MLLPPKSERGSTEFANRGTALHALAEDILMGREISDSYEGYTPTQDDIALTVIPYCEYVDELDADLKFIEKRIFVTPDCYGTSDCIAFNTKTKVLHVVDLKAGQGVMVYAQNNTQARIYAIGAINFLIEEKIISSTSEIEKVVTHIVQPGINNYGIEEVSIQDLKELRKEIISTINMIKNNEGQYAPSDEACRWCPHKIDCPKLNEFAIAAAKNDFEDYTSLADKMKMVAPLKHFIKEIEDESLKVLNQGGILPGFKLVQGRGSREWTDEKKLENALIATKINPEVFYSQPKLLSVAQLEKALKRESAPFVLDDFIHRKEGAAKIAEAESPQKELNKTENAKETFKDV
jgi:hypothetical protein